MQCLDAVLLKERHSHVSHTARPRQLHISVQHRRIREATARHMQKLPTATEHSTMHKLSSLGVV
jgi:hypothetical protein